MQLQKCICDKERLFIFLIWDTRNDKTVTHLAQKEELVDHAQYEPGPEDVQELQH